MLLHTCCAPCTVKCVEILRAEGAEPVLFWRNPNIHPYTEYQSRLDALRRYAAENALELVEHGEYGLRPFVRAVSGDVESRCGYCYASRLNRAAQYAAENGYAGFSTTLLISPYQKHDLIAETAQKAARTYGTDFVYHDFRPFFREGQAAARASGLYMQKYCGCIFSEEDRYRGKQTP
jgi:predicted adenine nucleotide alpha hydrolase (AANH) superfamily ATPase